MNIEEIKNKWSQINNELDKQKKFNSELFEKMTKNSAKSSLQKILNYEIVSAVVLIMIILFTVLRFKMLDTSLTFVCGIILILIAIASLSLSGILFKKIKNVKFYEKTLSETIKDVSNLKIYYYKYKMMSWISSLFFVFAMLPVFVKLLHNRNIIDDFSLYIIPVGIGLIIGITLAYYIFKNLYEFNLSKVENLLKDLKED